MDIEKLIRRLRNDADAYRNGKTLGRAFADQEDVLDNAATALSTLQAENEKLRTELERVKRDRDSAILFAQCYTEKVDNPCTVCRHRFNEVGAPLKKRCENCGLTGTPECGWEFDFNWDLKED